jgi:predicted glycosyltransferase
VVIYYCEEMKVLVDINHPSQVHLFKYVIAELRKHGHSVIVTASQKDVSYKLLDAYGVDYIKMGTYGNTFAKKLISLFVLDFRMARVVFKHRPDVLTGLGSFRIAHAGFLCRKKTLILEDTEHSTGQNALYKPFATKILTPSCFLSDYGKKQIRYEGCNELAYLHPKRFTPDGEIPKKFGIDISKKYCMIRFVSWKASHDIGQHGIMDEQKLNFIKEISKYARPYISSEAQLPAELAPYQLNVPPHLIHHIMAFASLYVGEGATMASESAILGVPAVYVNTLRLGYIDMHERYGLLKQTTDTDEALKLCIEFLTDQNVKEKCRIARQKLLSEKIDVTAYIVETIEKLYKGNV